MLLRNVLKSPLKSSESYSKHSYERDSHGWTDFVDLASVPSPSTSPAPSEPSEEGEGVISPSGSAKTYAFFASPFASSSAVLVPPPRPEPDRALTAAPAPKRTLTADFFNTRTKEEVSLPTPLASAPAARRNFLNLDSPDTPEDPEMTPTPKFEYPNSANTQEPEPDAELEGEELSEGVIIRSASSSTSLELIQALGEGTFSSVWLARDLSSTALTLKSRRSLRDMRKKDDTTVIRSSSTSSRIMKRLRGGVSGTRPTAESRDGSIFLSSSDSVSRASSISFKSGTLSRNSSWSKKRLVAVKLTLRGVVEGEQSEDEERERTRTRVSFVREVEILKHISHPNIPPLLAHLTTPLYHLLVLPFYPGGDLLAVINDDEGWEQLGEGSVRKIFWEICRGVGWMHSVGLVHRDIKLENILLTAPLPPSPTSSHLIKLTDFGLSRFIDPSNPLLTTRCGSEAYAAPELVVGGGRSALTSTPSSPYGGYDARETDSWACGVVLYALLCRTLPFGEGPGESLVANHINRSPIPGCRIPTAMERKQWLMRIAKAEWRWPTVPEYPQARNVAERLLVRDPNRRALVGNVLEDPWFTEDPAIHTTSPTEDSFPRSPLSSHYSSSPPSSDFGPELELEREEDADADEDSDESDEDLPHDGWLLDKDGIPSVAKEEVS